MFNTSHLRISPAHALMLALFLPGQSWAQSAFQIEGFSSLVAVHLRAPTTDITFAQSLDFPSQFEAVLNKLTDESPNNDIAILGVDATELATKVGQACDHWQNKTLGVKPLSKASKVNLMISPLAGLRVQAMGSRFVASRLVVDCATPAEKRIPLAIRSSLPYLLSALEFSGLKLLNENFAEAEESINEIATLEDHLEEQQEADAHSLALRIQVLDALQKLRRNALHWLRSPEAVEYLRSQSEATSLELRSSFQNVRRVSWYAEIKRLRQTYRDQSRQYPETYPLAQLEANHLRTSLRHPPHNSVSVGTRTPASQP